jgi:hypothetical protein
VSATAFLDLNYYQQVLGVPALIVVWSVALERALALPFEWGPIEALVDRNGLNAPVPYVAAWALCWTLLFDLLRVLGGKTVSGNGPFSIGTSLMAGVITRGSKNAVNARIAVRSLIAATPAGATVRGVARPGNVVLVPTPRHDPAAEDFLCAAHIVRGRPASLVANLR